LKYEEKIECKKRLLQLVEEKLIGWNFKTKDANQNLYQTERIDEKIVKLANKINPKLLFIGTATKENKIYYHAIKNIYEKLGCRVSNLETINKDVDTETIKKIVLSSDIIYIGGGNTKFMLDEWKRVHLDDILIDAYNQGIVMAGFSAGSYCWFKYNYELIKGLDIIQAINCVHYNEKSEEKRREFYQVIKDKNMIGIALENGTAMEYINDKYKIIKSIKNAKAYRIQFKNGAFCLEELEENIDYSLEEKE